MKINEKGLNLLKSFEGCRLEAYRDVVGILTIGYGHTGEEVVEGLSWTQHQAESQLKQDLSYFEDGVTKSLSVSVNENQFSALVCFSYNVGLGALQKSTLLKKLNAGDVAGAADQFLLWDKAGGKVIPGLHRRRVAERDLFLSDDDNKKDFLPSGPTDDEILVKLKENE